LRNTTGLPLPTFTHTSSENMVTARFLSCHRPEWRDFLSTNSPKNWVSRIKRVH
jgi:hypothetical protein